MSFLFKNYAGVVTDLLTRCNRTKFFLGSTSNTDKNGVNKLNTHTPNNQGKITMESVTMTKCDTLLF